MLSDKQVLDDIRLQMETDKYGMRRAVHASKQYIRQGIAAQDGGEPEAQIAGLMATLACRDARRIDLASWILNVPRS